MKTQCPVSGSRVAQEFASLTGSSSGADAVVSGPIGADEGRAL